MEQFTAGRYVVTIAANIQASAQDSSVRLKPLKKLCLCMKIYLAVTGVPFVVLCGILAVFRLYAIIISS